MIKKVKFLYSAISSPQDRSKRFTLYFPDRPVHSDTISASLGSIQPYAAINTRRLLVHIHHCLQPGTRLYSCVTRSWVELKTCWRFSHHSTQHSNPGPPSWVQSSTPEPLCSTRLGYCPVLGICTWLVRVLLNLGFQDIPSLELVYYGLHSTHLLFVCGKK